MRSKSTGILLFGLFAAMGAGCTSQPHSVGQQMVEQSKDTKELGNKWKDGNKRVAIGESIIAEGKNTIAKGNDRIKEGERMVAEGQMMMREAELIFKTRFPGQSLDGLK